MIGEGVGEVVDARSDRDVRGDEVIGLRTRSLTSQAPLPKSRPAPTPASFPLSANTIDDTAPVNPPSHGHGEHHPNGVICRRWSARLALAAGRVPQRDPVGAGSERPSWTGPCGAGCRAGGIDVGVGATSARRVDEAKMDEQTVPSRRPRSNNREATKANTTTAAMCDLCRPPESERNQQQAGPGKRLLQFSQPTSASFCHGSGVPSQRVRTASPRPPDCITTSTERSPTATVPPRRRLPSRRASVGCPSRPRRGSRGSLVVERDRDEAKRSRAEAPCCPIAAPCRPDLRRHRQLAAALRGPEVEAPDAVGHEGAAHPRQELAVRPIHIVADVAPGQAV